MTNPITTFLDDYSIINGVIFEDIQKEKITTDSIEFNKALIVLINTGFIPTADFQINWMYLTRKQQEKVLLKLAHRSGYSRFNSNVNTLFDYHKVHTYDENNMRFITLLHYISTYGAMNAGVEIDPYFPNGYSYKEVTFEQLLKDTTYDFKQRGDMLNSIVHPIYISIKDKLEISDFIKGELKKPGVLTDEFKLAVEYALNNETNLTFVEDMIFGSKEKELFILANFPDKFEHITPEMLLRYGVYTIGAQSNLLNSQLFKMKVSIYISDVAFDDKRIKAFWDLADKLIATDPQELLKFYKQKRKLWNRVLAGMRIKIYRYAGTPSALFFKRMKNRNHDKAIKTEFAIVEEKLNTSAREALLYLIDKPALFMQYFTRIINRFCNDVNLLTYIKPIVETKLSPKQLVKLYNISAYYSQVDRSNVELYSLPENKFWINMVDNSVDDSSNIYIVYNIIAKMLKNQLKNLFSNMKIRFPEQYTNFKIITSQTDKIQAGSYIEVPEQYNVIRAGIYWEDNEQGYTDLDLHATMIVENVAEPIHIGWNYRYKLDDLDMYFSGDMTAAPEGAAEFIDVDIQKALNNNIKYLSFSVSYFSGLPKNGIFGIQFLDKFRSSKNLGVTTLGLTTENAHKFFNPENIYNKMDLPSSEADSKIVTLYDVENRRLYYINKVVKDASIMTESNYSVSDLYKTFIDRNKHNLGLTDLFDNSVDDNSDDVINLKDYNDMVDFMYQIFK